MRILNIQRMSTEDGPGLRTTVFFKGCPLHCTWCHNPESIPFSFNKEWIKSSCIFCLDCIKVCKQNALHYKEKKIIINRALCNLCMKCVDVCPTSALKAIGEDISVLSLYEELIKDKAYFSNGGGITLSGGEVLLQTKEVALLLKRLKRDNLNIAIDTSGFADYENIKEIIPYTDIFLYDIKFFSEEKHNFFCNTSNQLIKENLIKLNQEKTKIWIRTPIIPKATDFDENILEIATFLKDNNIDFDRWELCAFNNLCKDKYSRLDLKWDFQNEPLMTKQRMNELETLAKSVLPAKSKNIFSTGTYQLEVQYE
ncbi:MAG: glycyl-radical enzyme activating protein [Firmicutes bacterium]|nr:glycyl-radical enzyme activating protein [Bacillota bacterium]